MGVFPGLCAPSNGAIAMRARLVTVLSAAALSLVACDTPLEPLGDTLEIHPTIESEPIQTNAVDLLWVIDSSTSMKDEQVELAAKFDALIAELAALGADFHIGVITTDLAAGQAGVLQTGPGDSPSERCTAPPADLAAACEDLQLDEPFLSWDDYAAEDGTIDAARLQNDFRCIASVGTCGAYYERGIEAVSRALSDELLDGLNAGFLREDAFLAVLFLTDEDDCSSGGALTPQNESDCYVAETRDLLLDTQAVYDQLVALKDGDPSRVLIGGIIGPVDPRFPEAPTRDEYAERDTQGSLFSCNRQVTGADEGAILSARDGMRYRELIELAGTLGVEASICAEDYTAALLRIGQVIRRTFDYNCLPSNPRPETCENNDDCPEGVACVNPADPALGQKYCGDFEVRVSISEQGPAGAFDELAGPGPASGYDNEAGAFSVDFDAVECPEGLAFSFNDGFRPPPGAVYRVSYTATVDIIDDLPDDETVGE